MASTNLSTHPDSTERSLHPAYFYLIVVSVFSADQVSKWVAERTLVENGPSRPILGAWFLLTLTHNTGGAWGLLPSDNLVFVGFALLAIVALLFAYHRMRHVDLLVASAFALALGGALGNLTDRLRLGYVIDFFEARVIHWPIFNIADSAISLGICLLMIHFLLTARDRPAPSPAHTHGEDALPVPPD